MINLKSVVEFLLLTLKNEYNVSEEKAEDLLTEALCNDVIIDEIIAYADLAYTNPDGTERV